MSVDTLCAIAFPPLVLLDYITFLTHTSEGLIRSDFGPFGPDPYNSVVNTLLLVLTGVVHSEVADGGTSRIYKDVPVFRLPLTVPFLPCTASDRPNLFSVAVRDVLVTLGVPSAAEY